MPCSAYYLIIYTIVILLSCFQFSIAGNNDTDRVALLEIKSKLKDPLGALNSWNDSLHFCNWFGVCCNEKNQRVTALDLHSLKLSGSLSPYIGNLSLLWGLQLQNNSLGGTLPPEIGRLHRLKDLLIYNNSIGGEIPLNISGCYSLITLLVDSNKLVGKIPDVLGSLLNLQVLYLSKNNLKGNIPSSLGNLTSLSELGIADTNIVGSIPNSLGRLRNLEILTLGGNKLSGLVPSSIFNLSRLTSLDLAESEFVGSLPSDIGITLPLLEWFSISSNSFSGVIPTSVSNVSNLGVLQLAANNLRGQVPSLKNLVNLTYLNLADNFLGSGQNNDLRFVSSLGNAIQLFKFQISQNNFGGVFPVIICNFSSIFFLALDINEIGGNIPVCMDNLSNLQLFSISRNQISGVIPHNIGTLQNLNQLFLDNNQLSGHIPSSVGNLTKLSLLNLARNNFVGQIPSSIGNCTNLIAMDLSTNHLNGSIPSPILTLSTLSRVLNLSNNYLTGALNSEVGQLKNLVVLDISSNMLSGEIPTSLSSCVELEFLNMKSNFFEGAIPDALKTLMTLQDLDLSRNNLSGKIPQFLVSLPLRTLNLSYNNFSGAVPVGGVFGNATGIHIVGNDMLCGGIHELKLPKCTYVTTRVKRSGHRKRLILAMIFGFLGIILLVTLALFSIYWYRIIPRRKTTNPIGTSDSLLNLSYQCLRKATNGFSSEKLIGSGTFGDVYKGILDPDETLVAIKVFKLEHHGASKSFIAECEVLRNIRHRNLVKVITACSSIDYQGNNFKALVYEFMVNRSLEDWLHANHDNQSLTFRQRLNIAIDVAFAVEYLHHGSGSSIVHCDLKPSNILLDEDMVAHVGDFGLAKFLSTSQALKFSSLGVRGTVGYAPPEYGVGNEVSTSGDVYSFGILLMELVTGKKPTLDMFKDGLNLHNFIQAALPEQVLEIIDGALLEDELNEDIENSRKMMRMLEASTSILGLALYCSTEVPQERLDMKEVVAEITAIRNKFIRTQSL